MTQSTSITRSARGKEVVAAGRRLLEEEGPEALTMRRLAERVGIRAPSRYKHLPDKAALEAAIIVTGLEEAAAEFEAAVEDGAAGALVALAAAYRRFALAHPHLYRLMNNGPLPREHLPPGLEDRTAAPVLRAAGSQARARALWAFAHGMVMRELDPRCPADADLDAAWRAGIAAFQPG
ncbi:MAG TPA: TetR/AcrR family transcriptional regulator [Actinomycetes bacterium]|nr:TetR/AcrR family transcriptional regulator [Actinomycetes bacterium]